MVYLTHYIPKLVTDARSKKESTQDARLLEVLKENSKTQLIKFIHVLAPKQNLSKRMHCTKATF